MERRKSADVARVCVRAGLDVIFVQEDSDEPRLIADETDRLERFSDALLAKIEIGWLEIENAAPKAAEAKLQKTAGGE